MNKGLLFISSMIFWQSHPAFRGIKSQFKISQNLFPQFEHRELDALVLQNLKPNISVS